MYPVVHIGSLSFYSFGLCVGLGILLSYRAFETFYRRSRLCVSTLRLFLVSIPVGFLLAYLDGAALTTSGGLQQLIHSPAGQLSSGGFTYLGGMLATLAASIAVIVLSGWPVLAVLDATFCASVGYAIGRIGCFLAGDGDYGISSSVPWAISFPRGVVPTLSHVHPTMLYSTVWELAVFAVFWKTSSVRRRTPLQPGILLGLYLIATSVGRFLIEFFSRNRTVAFGLTEAQLVSVALFVAGTTIVAFVSLKSSYSQAAIGYEEIPDFR